LQNPAEALEVAFTAQARDLRAVEQARREVEAAERGGIGSVKNLGRYAASWIACPSVPMMMRHRPPGSLALRVLKDDLAHAHDPDPD